MRAFVAEKQEDEDDFLFGSYQPSAAASSAGNSRPGSRRSVRCVCVYVYIHLPDLACAAQSEVCGVMCLCACVYTSSRPSLCHSVRSVWVGVYIFWTWMSLLTQL